MELFLIPTLVTQLVYLLGLAIALGYLAFLPRKSRDSWFILIMMLAWFVNVAVVAVYQATHTHLLVSGPGFENAPWLTAVFQIAYQVFLIFLTILVYRIGFVFAKWEERVVVGLLMAGFAYTLYLYVVHVGNTDYIIVQTRYIITGSVLINTWIVIAGIRKLVVAYVQKRSFHAKRLTMMLVLTAFASLVTTVAGSFIAVFWPFSAEVRGVVPTLSAVAVGGFMVVGYLLYSDEKHTLQVKLVGFLLIAYISVFVCVVPFIRTEVSLRQAFETPPDPGTLEFVPDSTGAYVMHRLPLEWFNPAGERYVTSDDAAVMVPSAFEFPFYGSSYDSIWVGTNGSMSFGRELDADQTYSSGLSFFDPTPSAVPMYADLNLVGAGSSIQIDPSTERYVATWNDDSLYDLHESTIKMQVALYPDGRIQFNYAQMTTLPLLRYVGITPGGEAQPVSLEDDTVRGAPGQALFEYTDVRDAYRGFVHPIVVPAAWIGLIGLVVVLIGGLIFYRIGLLNPLGRLLHGLREVEKGNLKTQVEIAERNELGALADHFNQMTVSIRNYSEHLEEMVEARTAELKSTQAQLVEQEKLASLGSLTAGIAHEIKNPLNFVNNFAEVGAELVEELDDALTKGNMEEAKSILKEITENAAQIAKHGRRADSIVKSMMQHARGGTSVPENVDLNAFLGEYIDLAWHGRRARDPEFQVEVVRRLDQSMGNVHIQPQEMGRVILNLLNNAFDALKGTEGARITVTTRRGERGVEITVEDNGPGIPADVRERIFEPFFTTKASGEGTGLGLSLSYDIVTKGHGGTMSVGTSPDGGAQFSISLPV